MFDIGWTEILILATISLFVIGPKEIPKFLGYVGKMIAKIKGISRELQDSVDDAIKNSELEDIRKEISFTDPDLSNNLNEIINPTKKKIMTRRLIQRTLKRKMLMKVKKKLVKLISQKKTFHQVLDI